MKFYITIDQLRSKEVPRLHGNGFIQIPLLNGRLHIWPYPALCAQRTQTQIHNHRFGFESTVLLGRTMDVRYDVFHVPLAEPGDYQIHEAVPRDREDTVLKPMSGPGAFVTACRSAVRLLDTGDRYTIAPFEYHEHLPTRELVATFMQKTLEFKEFRPRVLVPIKQQPDNDFNRYQVPEKDLWEIVEHVCKSVL